MKLTLCTSLGIQAWRRNCHQLRFWYFAPDLQISIVLLHLKVHQNEHPDFQPTIDLVVTFQNSEHAKTRTFPVIPKPLKTKLISCPWVQGSETPSTVREISLGLKLHPGGGCNCNIKRQSKTNIVQIEVTATNLYNVIPFIVQWYKIITIIWCTVGLIFQYSILSIA